MFINYYFVILIIMKRNKVYILLALISFLIWFILALYLYLSLK